MDKLNKERGPIRTKVSKTVNEAEIELKKDVLELEKIKFLFRKLENLASELNEIDQRVKEELLDTGTEAVYEKECNEQQDYVDRLALTLQRLDDKLEIERKKTESLEVASVQGGARDDAIGNRKTYKLPKVHIKKFGGEVTDWLSWWHQFQRIHDDPNLHDVDKFQYLSQSMKEGSKAADLIKIYPQIEENYSKAVKALQERFGKPKVLKRVYVRELLKMIINNSRGKLKIGATFDQLEAHLKALESLGITPDQMDVILFPMVESCLPEEILVAWQRSPNFGKENREADPPKTEFDFLMEFVKQEVENESQRELAQSGFGIRSHDSTRDHWKDKMKRKNDVPTAASLHSSTESRVCCFCGKNNHQSYKCMKAQRMTLDEKRTAVKKSGSCYRCLIKGHMGKDCRVEVRCQKCSKPHQVVMCPMEGETSTSSREFTRTVDESTTVANNSNLVSRMGEVLLKTVHVRVKGRNGRELEARLLFDDGSQHSYVKTAVAENLGCRSAGTVILDSNLFGGHQTGPKTHRFYDVILRGLTSNNSERLRLISEDVICSKCPTVPTGPWLEELKKENIIISDTWSRSPEVEVLIGSDLWGYLMTGRQKKLQCGLTAHESVFGWTLSGPIPRQTVACSIVSMFCRGERTIQDMWSLESLGIRDSAEQITKEEHDYNVKKKLQDTISRAQDGRYIVKLPWVDQTVTIPSNRTVAEKRLQRATEKLKNQDKLEVYNQIFQSWEAEGIIEVHEDSSLPQHFLPHRPVFKPESLTTPVRPVFDASCKVGRNLSLNQCLEKGPNTLELIPSILLRFRKNRFGVIADIRKAFQMVGVTEEDKNYQKFLWWEDKEATKIKEFRHCRVVFGMTCSPFILAAVLDYHLNQVRAEDKEIAEKLRTSLYVDNVVISVRDEEEYQKFQERSVFIMNEACMELRQWEHNLTVQHGLTNVLGLKWNKDWDTLKCQVPKMVDFPEKVNKRTVLSIVSQIFDPIGFTCPAVIQPKMLLQGAWAISIDWDKEWGLPERMKFKGWFDELTELENIEIPRYLEIGDNPRRLVQLHLFTDASKGAYAAVVFVRVEHEDGVSVQLAQAKSRLAPLDKKKCKRVTIPRLELMGCLIGARLLQSVREGLSLNDVRTICWSDSTTALSWIRRDEDWGTFVGNRSREINRITRSSDWRHVPGRLNPADLPSRGCTPSELLASKWWEGPHWLSLGEEYWPAPEEIINEDEVYAEKKKSSVTSMAAGVTLSYKFSSFLKNVRVAAWIRRFVENSKCKKKNQNSYLSIEELRKGELDLIRSIQIQHSEAIKGLKALNVVLKEDGLYHVDSRIDQREDTVLFRSPILLPKEDLLVLQLIEYIHRTNCHAGTQFVLGKLREKFWIPQGRKTVSKVINRCVICRRHTAKGMTCDPAPLPKNRIQATYAFQTTGVDLAGPLILKGGKKAWIVLYTCAVYRGVVLDIVDSINTEDFLESLQKFTWTNGRPTTIYSDNGTNFVGAYNLLKKIDVQKLQVDGINWIFNPPTAAWWGGWWERLVRTVKDLLKRMIGSAKLTRKELEKCLAQISYTINNRPLTTLTEDENDLSPLTPALFMKDLPVSGLPEMELLTSKDLQDAYLKVRNLRNALENRFRKEYLGLLVQRRNEKWKEPLQVGDVVLVGSDNKKRYEWPLGRIMELFPGKDKKIRVARVKTSKGVLLRPLQRLYPLEMNRSVADNIPTSVQKGQILVEGEESTEVPDVLPEAKRTRSGRIIRGPVRYSEWNY